jgi:predicted MFS family arabinose efflux permease
MKKRSSREGKLPMAGLLALFTAGFPGIINEAIPAGLPPEISRSLRISESVAGQTVTVYTVATARLDSSDGARGPFAF